MVRTIQTSQSQSLNTISHTVQTSQSQYGNPVYIITYMWIDPNVPETVLLKIVLVNMLVELLFGETGHQQRYVLHNTTPRDLQGR